jgi:spore maturation protein SpmB
MKDYFLSNISNGCKNGIKISYKIALFIFPCYIVVDFLKCSGILGKIGIIFYPVLKLMGLPPEASMVLLSGFLINLYAAIAAIVAIGLTVKQITIVGLVLGIAHNLVIESVILARSGVKAYITVIYRIILAITLGIMVNFIWNLI